MAHLFIKDIQPNQPINDIYVVSQPILRNTTRGDLYIAMFLSDKTGKLNSRMWQATEEIYQQIPPEGYVHIRGKSELYQGALQIVINDIQPVDPSKVNPADYIPRTDKDIAQMYKEMLGILAAIENEPLRNLVSAFVKDTELMKQFCTAPAAMQMHHNYLGGLLEHTLNMLKAAKALFPFYPKIQKDLVIAAVFLHDIAKTQELSYKVSIGYTDQGQLLGHIIQGCQLIAQKADKLAQEGKPVPQEILDNLMHIVISHHGLPEFGAVKVPATPEAFMVHYIDNLDAKMNQTTMLIENDPGEGNWTSYQKSLETKLYRNRVLETE
ncbi:MAG TPA: HD domain-containing protein [Anaerohalosphaeraceae bacterium]|nr:HD domain-containing protein [Anaerohalosphaeraceae bacterium]HOL88556.1 HD domain-containing protein [Anaerohalosphaeraceae bacterium]HPP56390.1 HD domain-containing protein [Anaerohalosphaeraceae bacterium]